VAGSVSQGRTTCSAATRNCSFWDWGEGNVRPHCCTDHLLELIDHVHAVLDRHGIRHWLDFGSLLGAVREGTLIPWDDDADIGILAADAPSVVALRQEIEATGHVLTVIDDYAVRVHYSAVNRIALDLTVWHERDKLLHATENPLHLWPGMHDRSSFPPELVETLGEVTLHGRRLPAPSDPHRLLEQHRYGVGYLTPTRPIVSLQARQVIGSTEMTDAAAALVSLVAERDAQLRGIARGRLPFAGSARWDTGPGRFLARAMLPLEPDHLRLNAARASFAPAGDTAAERLVHSLAWTEQAIDEYLHPPALIGLRRFARVLIRAGRVARRRALRFEAPKAPARYLQPTGDVRSTSATSLSEFSKQRQGAPVLERDAA